MAEVMKQAPRACPDLETIAAYLDGALSARERARVSEHLAGCEECYAVFRESAQMHVGDGGTVVSMIRWRERLRQPRVMWSAAAALAAAAAVAVSVWLPGLSRAPQGSAELQALVAAVGSDRPIEARLTGGFAYGPLHASVRSGTRIDSTSPDVRIAAATLEKVAAERPTARNLEALGIAYVVIGQPEKAINTLQKAAAGAGTDALIMSDLSAAYLARAASTGNAQDYAQAASEAEKALKANGVLPEAMFNRALALEKLLMFREARKSWEDYLRLDRDSAWADEAHRHLEMLPAHFDH